MSDEAPMDSEDGQEPQTAPSQPDTKKPDDASGYLKRIFSGLWHTFQVLLPVGVVFLALVAFLAWSSGIVDNLRSETPGVVHIESPQIYTRERLVNDRFREQAWLEQQLKELEDRAEIISSYRKDSFRIAAKSAPKGAEAADPPTQPATDDKDDDDDRLEEKLLVTADDSFNLQRNMRATIRRALIENELDDRHDLGSNSLYQFNFGAAIIAGRRTRRIAAIEMEIDPVKPLKPLNGLMGENSICAGLRQYECAFLFDTGVLTEMPDGEKADIEDAVEQYSKWRQLFYRWLRAENSAYEREAADVRTLLRSPQASARIRERMKPFFDNLDRQAKRFIDSFEVVSSTRVQDSNEECTFFVQGGKDGQAAGGESERNNGPGSIENEVLDFIRRCVRVTNRTLAGLGGELSGVRDFAKTEIGLDPDSAPDGASKARIEKTLSNGESVWGEYFLYVFKRFNEQCPWPNGDDLVAEMRRPLDSNIAALSANTETALNSDTETADSEVAVLRPNAVRYRLTAEVESSLLDCISRSVVRDFGSHPFGQVERSEQGTAQNSGSRSDPSTYRAQRGLSSIVVTNRKNEFKVRERTEYIGVASRYTQNTGANDLKPYPHSVEKLNLTCKRHGVEIPGQHNGVLLAGVSTNYWFDTIVPPVNQEIGWNVLAHLICASYNAAPLPGTEAPLVVDGSYTLPIGLFRFVDLLSDGQKTFSYSVQPSGAFSLQRRDRDTGWSFSGLFGGTQRDDQIAAGGDTTESWIEKQYQVIGFGTQLDSQDSTNPDSPETQRKAKFGWYVFPAATGGGVFARPVVQSANIKLSALVSLPAWWENVDITVTTSWRDADAPGVPVSLDSATEVRSTQKLRVELPTRLEFIRNHFPDSTAIRPSLYELHLPKVALRACEPADIVLKGERLWRSTVVTLGSQRSTLIQVMPDMRGIIARFDEVMPFGSDNKQPEDGFQKHDVPVTVWTSEGQKSVVDTVSVLVPEPMTNLIAQGKPPCGDPEKVSDQ